MSQSSQKMICNALASNPSSKAAMVRLYLIRHGETDWNKRRKIQGGGYDVPLNANGKEQAQKAAGALDGIVFDAVASSSLSRAKETADIVFEHHRRNAGNGNEPLRIVDEGFNEMRFGKFEGFAYIRKTDTEEEAPEDKMDELKLQQFLKVKKEIYANLDFPFPARGDADSFDEDHGLDWSLSPEDEVYAVENPGIGESTRDVEDRTIKALGKLIESVVDKDQEGSEAGTIKTTKHVAIVSHGRTNKLFIGAMIGGDSGKIGQSNVAINVLDHPGLEEERKTCNFEENTIFRSPSCWKGDWNARVLNYTDHVKGSVINHR